MAGSSTVWGQSSGVPMDMDSWSGVPFDMDSSCGVPMAMGFSCGIFAVGFLRVLLFLRARSVSGPSPHRPTQPWSAWLGPS